MVRRKNGETERPWRDLVQRQAASGLSVRQFCEQQQILQRSFYAWRRRLRQRGGIAMRPSATRPGAKKPHTVGELPHPGGWFFVSRYTEITMRRMQNARRQRQCGVIGW